MAKHLHLVLDLPTGSVDKLALPTDIAGTSIPYECAYLIGTLDGVNRTFTLPNPAIHNPPHAQVKIYHNGRRLLPSEYTMSESVPGGGYDIALLVFAPQVTSRLFADYVAP